MKLALFFFLSFAVHATAILIPISFNGQGTERAIMVTVLPIGIATKHSEGPGGGHAAADQSHCEEHSLKTPPGRTGDIAPALPPAALAKLPTEIPSVVADTIVTSITGVSIVGASNNTVTVTGATTDLAEIIAQEEDRAAARATVPAMAKVQERDKLERLSLKPAIAKPLSLITRIAPGAKAKKADYFCACLSMKRAEPNRSRSIASSGHDMLDQAATEALKKWRFVPARASGKPVETWVKIPIEFQLSNAKR